MAFGSDYSRLGLCRQARVCAPCLAMFAGRDVSPHLPLSGFCSCRGLNTPSRWSRQHAVSAHGSGLSAPRRHSLFSVGPRGEIQARQLRRKRPNGELVRKKRSKKHQRPKKNRGGVDNYSMFGGLFFLFSFAVSKTSRLHLQVQKDRRKPLTAEKTGAKWSGRSGKELSDAQMSPKTGVEKLA